MSDRQRRNRDRQGGDRGRGGRRGQEAPPREAALEYVLIGEDTCVAADLYPGPLPLKWHRIDPVRLLKPGLYLRRSGSLSLVSRDLVFDRAVMFALWEDPHTSYRVDGGRWVQPGLHAGFLVRSPLDDGPPWIPIMAAVDPSPREYAAGLLSPWLDQVSAVRFRASLRVEGETLTVSSEGELEEEAGTEVLQELMAWLAAHPEDDTPTAAAARMALVRNGHGLQRLALTLVHADAETSGRMLRDVLRPLAPEVAEVLDALWALWTDGVQSPEGSDAAVRQLATTLHPALRPDHPLQRPEQLALLTTWINGLFGARPDRDHVQPARALFATARFLRGIQRNLALFDHPDAELPRFPLDRPASAAIVRDLAAFPPDETDLERLLRALAVAEAFGDVARPNLDFLRPFRIAYPRLHSWPIAARSLLGRYDYVLSGWSFRGHEPRTGRTDAHRLGANLVTDQPTITGVRSLARTIALHPPIAAAATEAVRNSAHPTYQRLAELAELGDEALGEVFAAAATHPRITRTRLFDAILAAELMLARGQRTRNAPDALLDPVPPGDEDAGVRGHFMYWRMICRSVVPELAPRYIAFIDRMLDRRADLPAKLQAELFALARRVVDTARDDEGLVDRWRTPFATIAADLAEAQEPIHGELLDQLLGVLGRLDPDAWLDAVTRLVRAERIGDGLIGRVLDGARRHQVARVLVPSPLMRELHSRLCGGDPSGRAPGRAAWMRVLVNRSGKADAVRWLLDSRRNTAFFEEDAFVTFFQERALQAIDQPAEAVFDLLELAVRHVPDEDVDALITQLRRHTSWPAPEILRMLEDAGRREAALEWIVVGGCGSAEAATFLLDSHAERVRSGEELLRAATLLPALRRRFQDPMPDAATALERAFGRYRPNRRLPQGFLRACDAFRLAELDPGSEAGRSLARDAATWRRDGFTREFDLFLRACLETLTSRPLHDRVLDLLRRADAATIADDLATLLQGAVADAVHWGEEVLGGAGVSPAEVAALVKGSGALRILETALAASILSAIRLAAPAEEGEASVDGPDPAAVRAALEALGEAVQPLTAPPELPPEATERPRREPRDAKARTGGDAGPSTAAAEPGLSMSLGDALSAHLAARTTGESDAAEDPSGASAEASGGEAADGAAGGQEPADGVEETSGEAASAPVSPLAATLQATLVQRAARAVQAVVALWPELLEVLEQSPVRPRTLLERLATFHPAPVRIRRDVLFPAAERAQLAGLKVHDPLDLLTSAQLESAVAELDRTDVLVVLDVLMRLTEQHGLKRTLILERDGLLLPLQEVDGGGRVVEPESRDSGEDGGGQDEAEDGDHAAGDEERGDAAGDDDAGAVGGAEGDAEGDGEDSGEDAGEENDGRGEDGRGSGEDGDDEEGAQDSEGASVRPLHSLVRRVLEGRGSAAEAEGVFGDAVTPVLMLRLVRRNASLGVRVVKDRRHGRAILLSLREQRGGRRSEGRERRGEPARGGGGERRDGGGRRRRRRK